MGHVKSHKWFLFGTSHPVQMICANCVFRWRMLQIVFPAMQQQNCVDDILSKLADVSTQHGNETYIRSWRWRNDHRAHMCNTGERTRCHKLQCTWSSKQNTVRRGALCVCVAYGCNVLCPGQGYGEEEERSISVLHVWRLIVKFDSVFGKVHKQTKSRKRTWAHASKNSGNTEMSYSGTCIGRNFCFQTDFSSVQFIA